ncbi:hypothetical protein BDP81DRAFT_194122 [Colletotrichum phormii]|uniref:Uncharacterized protein n=1 Tax=Colletotrichum phormii TaxID=359342 RepID=A0AAJ0EHF4_9PEZI|nr:uncharacterized protein BDP81DRAFT_194122 [Colletotrichum phormii]KAK1638964.1 hypothetical protein BDP81DRAFT_194122 [Colletotrichum phormii]
MNYLPTSRGSFVPRKHDGTELSPIQSETMNNNGQGASALYSAKSFPQNRMASMHQPQATFMFTPSSNLTISRTKLQKHTTPGIRWSSPTQLLIRPSLAYLWESGRDPEFSNGYGRMW